MLWRGFSNLFADFLFSMEHKLFTTCERGASLVEAAIALPLFLFTLLISFDLFVMGYQTLTSQFLASEGLREVTIAPHSLSSTDRADAGADYVRDEANKFLLTIGSNDVTVCPVGPGGCATGTKDGGAPGELVMVRIQRDIRGIALRWPFRIDAVAIGRNEV